MKHSFKYGNENIAKKPKIREKIRLSKLGKTRSEETKQKIRETLRGRKLSDKHKQNIKKGLRKVDLCGSNNPNWKGIIKECPNCDKKFRGQTTFCSSHCYIIKMMERVGEKNPNWKGGISKNEYCPGWNQLAHELKEYDNYICQNLICKGKSEKITSHHIDYNKENCHPNNIITLCILCNLSANSNREWWRKYYEIIKEAQSV